MRAIAYLRVSTDETRQELGLAAQQAAIEAFAAREGHTIAERFVDTLSGTTPLNDSQALIQATAALRPGDVLIVQRLDRIGRDVIVNATIRLAVTKRGATLLSADGVANGEGIEHQFVRTLLDAAAQYERGNIVMRINAALAIKKERGEPSGPPPFGYARVGKHNVPNETEQAALASARALRELGQSWPTIAALLTNGGHKTRQGKPFTAQAIARLLK